MTEVTSHTCMHKGGSWCEQFSSRLHFVIVCGSMGSQGWKSEWRKSALAVEKRALIGPQSCIINHEMPWSSALPCLWPWGHPGRAQGGPLPGNGHWNKKWLPKSLQMVTTSMKLEYLTPWKESYDKSRPCIKKQRHHFSNNCPYSQNCGFSSSRVWMWELGHKEDWVPKNWWFWIVVLEKTLESLLDCKEIKPAQS